MSAFIKQQTKPPTNVSGSLEFVGCLELRPEHQRRYEQVKAWREAQDEPYFTELPKGHPLAKTVESRKSRVERCKRCS